MIGSLLMTSRRRIEIDMIRMSGPDFLEMDNRIMACSWSVQGLTRGSLPGQPAR